MSQVEHPSEEPIRSPTSPLDPKNKISPRKKLVLKAKEELQELQQSYEEEIDDVDATDSSLPIQNNWRTAYVNDVLFPNGTPQDVHVCIKFNTRTNPDPLRCNTTRFVDLREMDGTVVNSIYSSLKYELHQEVTIRYYNLCGEDKRMSFPPCLSMKIQVMSADTHEELKKSDTYLKGKIDCTLIPTETKKENMQEQTYTSTQKIQFAKGARDQKAFFQISYFDARDASSAIPILTLSSPNFSVWSRHTRNSSKKPGRPKKEQFAPPASGTFTQESKRVEPKLKKRRISNDSQDEMYSTEQHIAFDQYTSQFYQMLNFLSDKHRLGEEERKMAFKMAYQQLCIQRQQ